MFPPAVTEPPATASADVCAMRSESWTRSEPIWAILFPAVSSWMEPADPVRRPTVIGCCWVTGPAAFSASVPIAMGLPNTTGPELVEVTDRLAGVALLSPLIDPATETPPPPAVSATSFALIVPLIATPVAPPFIAIFGAEIDAPLRTATAPPDSDTVSRPTIDPPTAMLPEPVSATLPATSAPSMDTPPEGWLPLIVIFGAAIDAPLRTVAVPPVSDTVASPAIDPPTETAPPPVSTTSLAFSVPSMDTPPGG